MSSKRGHRLRELREAEGLSMQQLAARIVPPTTAPTIDKLEKGRMHLTLDWIYKIADALSVNPLEIIAPLPKVSPKEKRLLELLRGLGEPDQQAVYQVVDTMAQSIADPLKKAG